MADSLAHVDAPAIAKIGLTLATAVPMMLVSYHLAVRPMILGDYLNGRRYPLRLWPVGATG
jgi:hypothetical protein